MDETTALLIGALGALLGVLINNLVGLVGAWWESNREHERWLRQARLEAATDLLAVVSDATGTIADRTTPNERYEEHILTTFEKLFDADSKMLLLVPADVGAAVTDLILLAGAVGLGESSEYDKMLAARRRFLGEMRCLLGSQKPMAGRRPGTPPAASRPPIKNP